MTPHKDGSLEADIRARIHDTFPGPGIPIPEGQEDDELDVPLCARRAVTDKVVFGVTAVLVAVILGWGLIWPAAFQSTMGGVLGWVVDNLGWLFIIAATCFVLFAVWLALSKYGRIPLGADDEKPEFHTVSWIAMMFSAGMGIGLIFWGVTEPLTHFVNPPPGLPIRRPAPHWRRRCSTGASTRGRCMRSSVCRSPTAVTAWGAGS